MMILRKVYASSLASLLSLYGTKYPYLVSLSVTTQIESHTAFVIGSLDGGNLTMKSNAIDFHALPGVGGCSSPYGACLLALLFWHMSHSVTVVSTCFLIPGK
jgi:hypothetical protein